MHGGKFWDCVLLDDTRASKCSRVCVHDNHVGKAQSCLIFNKVLHHTAFVSTIGTLHMYGCTFLSSSSSLVCPSIAQAFSFLHWLCNCIFGYAMETLPQFPFGAYLMSTKYFPTSDFSRDSKYLPH